MTPEREAELFYKLDLILELYRRLEGEVRDMRADLRNNGDRLSRVEGRLEEQSKSHQIALAGRLPRKPAA